MATRNIRAKEPRIQEADRPSAEDAKEAVRTLLRWAGDDPDREGLQETPERVVRAYREWFSGYWIDPTEFLSKTFTEDRDYLYPLPLTELLLNKNLTQNPNWK